MPYMMAGFPDHESSLAVAAAYADSGADLIELGVPFSDPLADGPTIHAAATAALAAGATLESALEVCAAVAERVPVVLMAYANMVLAHGGAEEFAGRAAAAGAAGAIVPDLPLGEAEDVARGASPPRAWRWSRWSPRPRRPSGARGSARPPRASSTSSRPSAPPASGTSCPPGSPTWSPRPRPTPRSRSRSASGSARPEQAAEVGEVADGVIIGSRLVRAAAEAGSARGRAPTRSRSFLRETRAALAG